MSKKSDNENLDFLPSPGDGRFWVVEYSEKVRSKPLRLALKEAFREGSPLGHTIGFEFCSANEKSLTDTAHLVLINCADRKKYVGTSGAFTSK